MSQSTADSSPGSPGGLRAVNQQRVLDLLRDPAGLAELAQLAGEGDAGGSGASGAVGPSAAYADDPAFTQAQIARATGLAPATVSNIVRELSAVGLVTTAPGSGRRGSAVRLDPGAGTVAGIDFGHSHVAVALGSLTGRVLAEQRRVLDIDHHAEEALDAAARMLEEMTGERAPGQLRHVGLGLPAPVTQDIVRSPAIFPGWEDVDTRALATARLGVPVSVENDANLGALAEHRRGIARGHDSSVLVKISSGVGAGIILDGQLFHGSFGTAGEIGHLTLHEQGPLCRCGSRGCLEAYTSVGTVLEMVHEHLPDATFDDVVTAAEGGQIWASRALEDVGVHLGWALASIANLLNPAVVVLGGEMAKAGELVLEPARHGLRRHALDSVAQTPVVASVLGERASLLGAVVLAAERTELVVEV